MQVKGRQCIQTYGISVCRITVALRNIACCARVRQRKLSSRKWRVLFLCTHIVRLQIVEIHVNFYHTKFLLWSHRNTTSYFLTVYCQRPLRFHALFLPNIELCYFQRQHVPRIVTHRTVTTCCRVARQACVSSYTLQEKPGKTQGHIVSKNMATSWCSTRQPNMMSLEGNIMVFWVDVILCNTISC